MNAPSAGCGSDQSGFSLLELLITVTVLGILTAIAVPSYTRFIAAQRVRAAASDIYLSVVRARGEALKRSTTVTITPNASGWQNGWTIPDPASGSTSILETHAALTGVAIAGPTSLVYQSSGRISAATPSCSASPTVACFVITSPTWSGASSCVSIDLSGRPYSVSGVTTC